MNIRLGNSRARESSVRHCPARTSTEIQERHHRLSQPCCVGVGAFEHATRTSRTLRSYRKGQEGSLQNHRTWKGHPEAQSLGFDHQGPLKEQKPNSPLPRFAQEPQGRPDGRLDLRAQDCRSGASGAFWTIFSSYSCNGLTEF